MQNTSLGTIRPNYEMRQLRLYIATALVYLSIARLNPALSVKITFATLSVLHGVVKHAIFAGVYR